MTLGGSQPSCRAIHAQFPAKSLRRAGGAVESTVVLKTTEPATVPGVQIPLPPPVCAINRQLQACRVDQCKSVLGCPRVSKPALPLFIYYLFTTSLRDADRVHFERERVRTATGYAVWEEMYRCCGSRENAISHTEPAPFVFFAMIASFQRRHQTEHDSSDRRWRCDAAALRARSLPSRVRGTMPGCTQTAARTRA